LSSPNQPNQWQAVKIKRKERKRRKRKREREREKERKRKRKRREGWPTRSSHLFPLALPLFFAIEDFSLLFILCLMSIKKRKENRRKRKGKERKGKKKETTCLGLDLPDDVVDEGGVVDVADELVLAEGVLVDNHGD